MQGRILSYKKTKILQTYEGKQLHIEFYIQKVWQEKVISLLKIFSCIVHKGT
jgi:hypothetical protein